MSDRLDVYVNDTLVGWLADSAQGFAFSYLRDIPPANLISLLMPVRPTPYISPRDLAPIFQMNLPEGYQKTVLQQRLGGLARLTDWGLLEITGNAQIGRNRVVPTELDPHAPHLPIDLARLLASPDSQNALLQQIATHPLKGVSGVMPKALGEGDKAAMPFDDFILKTGSHDYSGLAINEYLCLQVARAAGLDVPAASLSEDGQVLAVARFDKAANGLRLGFEDFCALAGFSPLEKYDSSLEHIANLHKEYVGEAHLYASSLRLLTLCLVNYALQNGDAHLKNFALVYTCQEDARLAPAYDIVTTTAHITTDAPALTLEGRKTWWPGKGMERLAQRLALAPTDLAAAIARVQNAIDATVPQLEAMIARYPDTFRETGKRMLVAWAEGKAAIAGGKRMVRAARQQILAEHKLSDAKPKRAKANPYVDQDSAFSTKPGSR